jgi:ribosomal protein L24
MVDAVVGEWRVIQGGKDKGHQGQIIRFAQCMVVVSLFDSHSDVMIQKTSLYHQHISASKDCSNCTSFFVGCYISIIRGKYCTDQGVITKGTACMLQVTIIDGMTAVSVRVQKSSGLLLLKAEVVPTASVIPAICSHCSLDVNLNSPFDQTATIVT